MRLTFTDLQKRCEDGSGGDDSSATQTFFKQRLNTRYEQVIGALEGYETQLTRTFSTVADQQYYYFPPNMKSVASLKITVNSKDYVLDPVASYDRWDHLNSIDIQAGAIPELYFNRRDDFGIYPIPQAVYTGTIVYNIRASGLTRSDYTTGTVTATENSTTVTGSGTSWSSNVVAGEWFSLADSNGESRGSWYRIASVTDNTNLELETNFEETTATGSNYIIGESPEIPPDTHELLVYGALADYFAENRQDINKAQAWENKFWTGDFNNSSREPSNARGGLLKAEQYYKDRSNSNLVQRRRKRLKPKDKVFATDIS